MVERKRKTIGDKPLTKTEIAKRQREKLRKEGKAQFLYWIDVDLGEKIKELARAEGLPSRVLVEKIFKDYIDKSGISDAEGKSSNDSALQ